MPLISENFNEKKLKEKNINIKTQYIVGNEILERNSDGSKNDDITSGIRTLKTYYHNGKEMHREKLFDTRIEYSFIFGDNKEKLHRCPNCGIESKIKDFIDGCPYCGTYYNIDYSDKDLGSKYHYDLILRKNSYKFTTLIIDIIISFIISFIYIKSTSRTFNNYDIIKILTGGILISAILYYFFYLLDAYVILGPIKAFKEKENQKQKEFWYKTQIDKKSFFNNLNYELRKKFYSDRDIIDFDIIDYTKFNSRQQGDDLIIDISIEMRIVSFINNKFTSTIKEQTVSMKKNKNNKLELNENINIINCHNCGASIDVNDVKCKHCDSEIKYLQDWIMI